MTRWRWLALALVAAASMSAVACGGASDAAAVDKTSSSATGPTARLQPVVAELSEVPSNGAAAVSRIGPELDSPAVAAPREIVALDADEIVAAYERVLGGIYESVLPSVVRIKVEKSLVPRALRGSRQAPEGFNVPGEGSGFVWSDRGHVVTNHHVVADADRITVIFADGSELDAELLGSDPGSDLAVLKVEPPSGGLREVVLGDSGSLKVGQLAVAIGSPYGQDFTMTRGIVSALGRAIPSVEGGFSNPQVIQTDAPINPGNSGGPLLDRRGKVIGINSQIISSSGANAGVGFAVPINTAKRIVPELIADGTYEYAYLGINGASLTPRLAEANDLPGDTRGTLVVGLVNGGPAEEAGLHAADATSRLEGSDYPIGGDVITGIDGETIVEMNDLIAYLAENNRPGDEVTLEVLRDGGTKSRVDVKLGSRPGPATG